MPRKISIGDITLLRKGEVGLHIQLGDKYFCIDPGGDIENCDVILCTHTHERHCSKEKLAIFDGYKLMPNNGTQILKPGDIIQINGLIIKAIQVYNKQDYYIEPVQHPKGCCLGYFVKTPGNISLLYTGDTNLIDELLDIDEKVTILVPSIGYIWSMTPEEGFELVKSLKPLITIPVHYSDKITFYKFRDLSYLYTQVINQS